MSIKVQRTIQICYDDFCEEINKLQSFDRDNNLRYNDGRLTIYQLELMTEAIFFAGFRAYEGFIRELFILYCLGEQPLDINTASPVVYISPISFMHGESMIKSSSRFIEWNSVDEIISRSEMFLKDGHPIKIVYTTHKQDLENYRKLRNHIAHNSPESEDQYNKIVRIYYSGILPISIPPVGNYLRLSSRINRENYILLDFFDTMHSISEKLTH